MKFTYRQNFSSKQWYWRLKSANGEIVGQGEGYKNEEDCLGAITLVKSACGAPVAPELPTVGFLEALLAAKPAS
jgi:uncharacterized protein YegP (UPF0339 family)